MGAEAIQDLWNADLEAEIAELKEELKTATGQKRVKAVRRLTFLMPSISLVTKPNEWFLTFCQYCHQTSSNGSIGWWTLVASDLNDLYRRYQP